MGPLGWREMVPFMGRNWIVEDFFAVFGGPESLLLCLVVVSGLRGGIGSAGGDGRDQDRNRSGELESSVMPPSWMYAANGAGFSCRRRR